MHILRGAFLPKPIEVDIFQKGAEVSKPFKLLLTSYSYS